MTDVQPPTSDSNAPVLMSFPAILRAPGVSINPYAQLLLNQERASSKVSRKAPGATKIHEGKRRIRRRENARFTSNPHIVLPSKKDYTVPRSAHVSSWPQPLPTYIHRNNNAPSPPTPVPDVMSSNAGHFTMGLKGMRKHLRRSGHRTQLLVQDLEQELEAWLEEGNIVVYPFGVSSPQPNPENTDPFNGRAVNTSGTILEIERGPSRLVWSVQDDHARYIAHCVARWHGVVSFSKDVVDTRPSMSDNTASNSAVRLTYLLRPHVTRPNPHLRVMHSLDTPPTTDFDSASSIAGHGPFSTDNSEFELDRLSDAGTTDFELDSELGDTLSVSDGGYVMLTEDGRDLSAPVPTAQSRDSSPSPALSRLALNGNPSLSHMSLSTPTRPSPLSHAVRPRTMSDDGEDDADGDADSDVVDLGTPRPTARTRARTRPSLGLGPVREPASSPSRSPAPPDSGSGEDDNVSVQLEWRGGHSEKKGMGVEEERVKGSFWRYLYG